MILSHGRRYLFIHIPKTGGTSLALALEGRAMKDDIMLGDTPKARNRRSRVKGIETRGRLWKHSTVADLDGLISAQDLDGLFLFALVRNPWARAVSYYHWLRRQEFDHPAVRIAKAHDFSPFLNHRLITNSFRASPARHYVTDATGRERPALFIRLEHFEEDAAPLFDHLGFRLELPQENVTGTGATYRQYYSESDSLLLADSCAEDINRFGYRFDGV
ncbi:MAG: sulfotransferase family 2 domain-containing protein [Pseudomonadota bacterium]|nr:sulfotransferase family 2 domain-containing protein [Pseudomonadota bacterium]